MVKHRSHSIDFKRQVAQEFLAGETLHGLAKRHDISRNLIRVWVEKYEAGAFDDDARAADTPTQILTRTDAVRVDWFRPASGLASNLPRGAAGRAIRAHFGPPGCVGGRTHAGDAQGGATAPPRDLLTAEALLVWRRGVRALAMARASRRQRASSPEHRQHWRLLPQPRTWRPCPRERRSSTIVQVAT